MSDQRTPTCVIVKKEALSIRGYKSFLAWSSEPGHLYICRKEHAALCGRGRGVQVNTFTKKKFELEKRLELYEKKIRNTPELMEAIEELEGMELGCWCKPGPCHGDLLVKIFKEVVEGK